MHYFPVYDGPPLMEQVCHVENLTNAWRRVRSNIQVGRRHRSAGVDAITLQDFERDWTNQMSQLADELRAGCYQPLPVRMVRIPKASGGERAIAILAVRDRIAQRAMQQVLEPLFDPLLLDCSYGCRLHVGVPHALAQVIRYAERGLGWVLDGDIANYFDTIDHAILLRLLEQRIPEAPVLRLLEQWLDVGVLHTPETTGGIRGNERWWSALVGHDEDDTDEHESTGDAPYAVLASEPVSLWERNTMPPATMPGGWSPYRLGMTGGSLLLDERFWTAVSLAQPALHQARKTLPRMQRAVQRVGGPRLAMLGAGIAVATGAVAAGEMMWRQQRTARRGTPQGGAISPLLANIYLHPFDLALTRQGFRLVRFMDDFVVMCASEGEVQQAWHLVERQLTDLRLALNPEKTRVARYDAGFTFLGQQVLPRQRGPRLTEGVRSFAEAAEAFGFGKQPRKKRHG